MCGFCWVKVFFRVVMWLASCMQELISTNPLEDSVEWVEGAGFGGDAEGIFMRDTSRCGWENSAWGGRDVGKGTRMYGGEVEDIGGWEAMGAEEWVHDWTGLGEGSGFDSGSGSKNICREISVVVRLLNFSDDYSGVSSSCSDDDFTSFSSTFFFHFPARLAFGTSSSGHPPLWKPYSLVLGLSPSSPCGTRLEHLIGAFYRSMTLGWYRTTVHPGPWVLPGWWRIFCLQAWSCSSVKSLFGL